MKAATGDLKKLIDTIDTELLWSDGGAAAVRALVAANYTGILGFPLPKPPNGFFDNDLA